MKKWNRVCNKHKRKLALRSLSIITTMIVAISLLKRPHFFLEHAIPHIWCEHAQFFKLQKLLFCWGNTLDHLKYVIGWIWLWAASRPLEQEQWYCTRECISTNNENVDLLGKMWNWRSLSKTKNSEKAFERLFMDLALSGWIIILYILDWVMLMFPWKW